MATAQGALRRIKQLGWTIVFNKETKMNTVTTPVCVVRFSVSGELKIEKQAEGGGWVEGDARKFNAYLDREVAIKKAKNKGDKK